MALTDNQNRAVELYTQGNTITDIAKIVGVSRPTIYDWLKLDEFKATVDEYTTGAKIQAEKKLNSKVGQFVDGIEKLALAGKSEKIRLEALQYVLNRIYGTPTNKVADVSEEDKEKPTESRVLEEEFAKFRVIKKAE